MLNIRKMLGEFGDFAFKGSMIDLAVGVVIGTAFKGVIDAIIADVIMPIIGLLPGLKGSYETWEFHHFKIGNLANVLLNFMLMAAVVFFVIVKLVGALVNRAAPPPPAGEPTTKECPKCLSIIPIKAIKCAHCTADLV